MNLQLSKKQTPSLQKNWIPWFANPLLLMRRWIDLEEKHWIEWKSSLFCCCCFFFSFLNFLRGKEKKRRCAGKGTFCLCVFECARSQEVHFFIARFISRKSSGINDRPEPGTGIFVQNSWYFPPSIACDLLLSVECWLDPFPTIIRIIINLMKRKGFWRTMKSQYKA